MPKERVLVVDDDELSRYLIRQVLRDIPCSILEASDGYEALHLLRQQKPDLITLDLAMPGLGGAEILEELKADPGTQSIPVVVITAKLLSPGEREDLTSRAHAVLNKSELGGTPVKSLFSELLNNARKPVPVER
jgi:CheY-like chemotaxis protein